MVQFWSVKIAIIKPRLFKIIKMIWHLNRISLFSTSRNSNTKCFKKTVDTSLADVGREDTKSIDHHIEVTHKLLVTKKLYV